MPTYTYKCKNDHIEDIEHGFHAHENFTCAKCHSPLKKTFYPVGVSFKGSGFYRNDSRKQTE